MAFIQVVKTHYTPTLLQSFVVFFFFPASYTLAEIQRSDTFFRIPCTHCPRHFELVDAFTLFQQNREKKKTTRCYGLVVFIHYSILKGM